MHGSLMGLDRKWHGLRTEDANYVEGAANFLPALVELAPRHCDELVKDLNRQSSSRGQQRFGHFTALVVLAEGVQDYVGVKERLIVH